MAAKTLCSAWANEIAVANPIPVLHPVINTIDTTCSFPYRQLSKERIRIDIAAHTAAPMRARISYGPSLSPAESGIAGFSLAGLADGCC
jgi:hypothetical protein